MQKIKNVYYFVKEYPKLSLVLVLLVAIAGRMAWQNYSLQSPIVNKRSESYTEVWNGRAVCLTQLDNLASK